MSEQQLNVLVTGASGKHTFKEIKDKKHYKKLLKFIRSIRKDCL